MWKIPQFLHSTFLQYREICINIGFSFLLLLLLSAKIVENTTLLQICKSLQIKTISPNCAVHASVDQPSRIPSSVVLLAL